MYIEHPDFEQPNDISTKVWRYMDLAKFLSLLETSSLYFTRSDKFLDPYEGTIPKINSENISTYFSEFENADEMRDELINLFDINRKLTLVNCWYQSQYESDAMWQLYSNNGIAIQSTFENLMNSFSISKDDILIGQVKYIDYEKEGMYFLNALNPFLFKRNSFEHEREIRAVIWNTKTSQKPVSENDKVNIEIVEHGKFSQVSLDTLIEAIYVSPTAPKWFHKLIESIIKKYKLEKPVIHSRLYTVENSSNPNKSEHNEITISKDILEHFYKKDSYRISIETLKSEREKFREYESFTAELKLLESEVEKCTFVSKAKYSGKEALLKFSNTQFSKKEIEGLFNKTQFKTLYFISGKVDTLLKDIEKSSLTEKEKEILSRKIIYFYTENIFQPSLYLALQIEKYNIQDQAFQIFNGFTKHMAQLTVEKKV